MKLARVIGTVVATRKIESISHATILMVQPLDGNLENDGAPLAAIDTVEAGPGDLVYCTLAKEAALALPEPFAPVDATITGIVDQVHLEDVGIKGKKDIFEKLC
jgi:microcompartment protein CcmK/EutM